MMSYYLYLVAPGKESGDWLGAVPVEVLQGLVQPSLGGEERGRELVDCLKNKRIGAQFRDCPLMTSLPWEGESAIKCPKVIAGSRSEQYLNFEVNVNVFQESVPIPNVNVHS